MTQNLHIKTTLVYVFINLHETHFARALNVWQDTLTLDIDSTTKIKHTIRNYNSFIYYYRVRYNINSFSPTRTYTYIHTTGIHSQLSQATTNPKSEVSALLAAIKALDLGYLRTQVNGYFHFGTLHIIILIQYSHWTLCSQHRKSAQW